MQGGSNTLFNFSFGCFSCECECNCGKALVIRRVKAGPEVGQQFVGCSGLPRWRVTQRL